VACISWENAVYFIEHSFAAVLDVLGETIAQRLPSIVQPKPSRLSLEQKREKSRHARGPPHALALEPGQCGLGRYFARQRGLTQDR
jgi:hypothetical protein